MGIDGANAFSASHCELVTGFAKEEPKKKDGHWQAEGGEMVIRASLVM